MIDFDTLNRQIALSYGNTEDVYTWRESHRTIYKTLLAIGENETVPLIKLGRRFYVTVESPNTISVSFSGDDYSVDTVTMTFARIDEDPAARGRSTGGGATTPAPFSLSGPWKGDDGLQVEFGEGTVRWTRAGRARSGSWALFTLADAVILTVRLASDGASPALTTSWRVAASKKSQPGQVVSTLQMSPVRLYVSGWQDDAGAVITLRQTVDNPRD
jgi:hypothetical protein